MHMTSHPVTAPTNVVPKTAAPLAVKLPRVEDLPERVREYAVLRGLGYAFRQIGQAYHVTPQAVSIMLSRHRQCLGVLGGIDAPGGLSSRAANVLGRLGIHAPAQARGLDLTRLLANQRNCGRKTADEIRRWAAAGNEAAAV
jgi:hypothetical protein